MTRFSTITSSHGGDVVQPQVVALAHVGDHGHLAAVKAQALRAARRPGAFEHGRVHLGVGQHVARAFGPEQSPLSIWRPATYTPSVLVMPTRRPCGGEQLGDQPGGGGLAVGARHRHDRNAAIVVRRRTADQPWAGPRCGLCQTRGPGACAGRGRRSLQRCRRPGPPGA